MAWAVVFLALLTYCPGLDGQSSWTQPPSSSVAPGETVKLSCTTTHTSYYIGWYQQKPGGAPRFVHAAGYNRGEGIPDRFTATQSGTTGSLTLTSARPEDEAVYYCGRWNSAGSMFLFGGGTQLTVTGRPTVSPSVQVFAPSREEVGGQNPYTVVCLVSEFYPPGFTLQWKDDKNQVIPSGAETTKATKQGDKYLASSYLRLSAPEYEKHSTFTCEVTHESKTIAKTVSKFGSC